MLEPPAPATRKLRISYAAAAVCTIAAGLAWRRPELGLPQLASKYGGSVLWGAMVFFVVAALMPRVRLTYIALLAAIVAAGVEFGQLLHIDWLDAFRRTTFGRLLLGVTFAWGDIASYWIGIALAGGMVAGLRRAKEFIK